MSHIIIVDDDLKISEQIEGILYQSDIECLPLLEPHNLFANLNYETPDLILLDINMPEINGLELLRQLKAHPEYQSIPIIMITGESDVSLLADCFEAGAMDFLNKPFDATVLQARIGSALRVREYQQNLETEIKERKQLQAQLVQAAKLAAVGRMGTGIAHEMNTPLGVIRCSIAELREELEDGEMDRIPKILERIDKQVDRTAEVTGYLRNFAGDMDPNRVRKILPEKLTKDLSLLLSERLKTNGIEWEIETVEDLPEIRGVPLLLQQALFYLVSNAQDAVKDSAQKRIVLRVFSKNDSVFWEVEDSGMGIPEKIIPQIFDPFFTTKPVGGGYGLGLSASYGIAEEHKGHLSLKQTSTCGSIFQMTLPADRESFKVI